MPILDRSGTVSATDLTDSETRTLVPDRYHYEVENTTSRGRFKFVVKLKRVGGGWDKPVEVTLRPGDSASGSFTVSAATFSGGHTGEVKFAVKWIFTAYNAHYHVVVE